MQGRKRSRVACFPCRELKRKCDGAQPCGACVRFEYNCEFPPSGPDSRWKSKHNEESPLGRKIRASSSSAPANTATPGASAAFNSATARHTSSTSLNHLRSSEANSGAAFLRRLAQRLDPSNVPRIHTFAWNAFLDARSAGHQPAVRPLTAMLSMPEMMSLTSVYFQKVDWVYGFTEKLLIDEYIRSVWDGRSPGSMHEAVLCGIAALGLLFSTVQPRSVEVDLVETARSVLEPTWTKPPTINGILAWTLRLVYLRVAGTHHEAWMTSSMIMHMIEAAGLHREPSEDFVLTPATQQVHPEARRRLVAVAQHHNIWTSFDMGRSRVTLCNATIQVPAHRPGDLASELMELLPYSAQLDPEREPEIGELEGALVAVLGRKHSGAPSNLALCNLGLCLYRRLQSMNATFSGTLIEDMLRLTSTGIRAALDILASRTPWHHMASVPFQIVCVLLAIDTPSSIAQLKDAIQCLSNICLVYDTEATQEALKTASLLVLLQKRWKEKSASDLGSILEQFPSTLPPDKANEVRHAAEHPETTNWLELLEENLSSIPDSELNQLFPPGILWDMNTSSL